MARDTLPNGGIVQDGMTFRARPVNAGEAMGMAAYPIFGRVLELYYVDDADENPQGETTLCDVMCNRSGVIYKKVPFLVEKGGVDNYIHHSPQPSDANVDFTPFDKLTHDPGVANGDTVLVIFPFGDVHQPYIMRVLAHNQAGANGLSPDPRPGADDGDCYKVRMNGSNFFMDKDGNVSFKTTDTLDKSVPKLKTFTIDFNGTTIVLDSNDDSISIAAANGDQLSVSKADGIQASTPASGGTSLSMKNGKVDVTGAQGLSLTDGNGNTVEVNPADDAIKATHHTGSQILLGTDGSVNLTDSSGNQALGLDAAGNAVLSAQVVAKLAAATIELGTSPTFHAVLYENLKALYDVHTHATGVGPSGAPLVTMASVAGSPVGVDATKVKLKGNT